MRSCFFLLLSVMLASSSVAQDEWIAPKSSKETLNPYKDNEIAKQKGEMLYNKLCWTCHGRGGLGDGPAGKGLKPKPKSFVSADVQKQTDGELFWKLSNGKGMMMPYKHSLKESQRWQLINYIRSLNKKQ